MLKVYALIFIMGILGTVAYGAKYYYDSTQARIETLRENNAKLEVAMQTAQDSMDLMRDEMARNQELMNELSSRLRKAEQYGDDLRNKLRQMDLVQDAIKDASKLEGKMNGATAKLWRAIVEDTGGTPDPNLPQWLQPIQPATGTGDQGSNKTRENSSPNSIPAEASTTN